SEAVVMTPVIRHSSVALLLVMVCAGRGGEPARVDRFGDPLPEGALMRLGTVGLRLPGIAGVGIRPSGELVALTGDMRLHVWPADGQSEPRVINITDKPEWSMREALAPDARFVARFAARSRIDRKVEVWDVSGKQPVPHLTRDMEEAYQLR